MTLLKPSSWHASSFSQHASFVAASAPNLRHGHRSSSIPTMEERVRASESFDKEVLISAHMAALHDAYVLEMATHPASVVNEPPIAAPAASGTLTGLKPVTLRQLKVGKVHRRHVLHGALCSKTLCRKSRNGHVVVNVLEDEQGHATTIHLSNALQCSDGGSAQAQRMFPQHSKVAIRDPYLTRLSDGQVVLLVEKMMTDLVFLWIPDHVDNFGGGDGAAGKLFRHRRELACLSSGQQQDENVNPNSVVMREFPFGGGKAPQPDSKMKEERNRCRSFKENGCFVVGRNVQSCRWIESAQRRASMEAKKKSEMATKFAEAAVTAKAADESLLLETKNGGTGSVDSENENHHHHRRKHDDDLEISFCNSSSSSSSSAVSSIEFLGSDEEEVKMAEILRKKEADDGGLPVHGESRDVHGCGAAENSKAGEDNDAIDVEDKNPGEVNAGGQNAIATEGSGNAEAEATTEDGRESRRTEKKIEMDDAGESAKKKGDAGATRIIIEHEEEEEEEDCGWRERRMKGMGEEDAGRLREKGNFLFKRGQFLLAGEMYKRAVEQARGAGDREEVVKGLSNRAEVWLRLRKNDKAVEDAEAAIALILLINNNAGGGSGGNASGSGGGLAMAKALFRKARALVGLELYSDAMKALEVAHSLAPCHRDVVELIAFCRRTRGAAPAAAATPALKPSSRRRRRRSEKLLLVNAAPPSSSAVPAF